MTRHLKIISSEPLQVYYNSYYPILDYKFIQFNYGGSFDRHTCIRQRYDVDPYLVYNKKNNLWSTMTQTSIIKGQLFEMLRNHLETFKDNYNVKLAILKEFPYTHAIPIEIDFKDQILQVDCIPAIEYNQDFLVVPKGMNYTKIVNPNLEAEALIDLNNLHNGNATKIILK